MIVIKGNLILKQVRISTLSETSSDKIDIVAYADLSQYNIDNVTIFEGDVVVSSLVVCDTILVTGNVVEE